MSNQYTSKESYCSDYNITYDFRVDDPGVSDGLLSMSTFCTREGSGPQHRRLQCTIDLYYRCNADHYTFCIVPDSGQDAVLFAAVAVLVTCAMSAKLNAIWVLIAGETPCTAY